MDGEGYIILLPSDNSVDVSLMLYLTMPSVNSSFPLMYCAKKMTAKSIQCDHSSPVA